MHRPFLVALTGGIATGKSTVSALFAELGVPVVDADEVARELVSPGSALLERIFERFGQDLRAGDGGLRRDRLRQRVFADPAEREALEALMHPAINQLVWSRASAQSAPYCIVAVPLLLETGQQQRADRVLVIDAPPALQRERLRRRDASSAAEADAILAAQCSRERRLACADDVIVNDGGRERLRAQVAHLHRRYLELAGAVCQGRVKTSP